MAHYAFLDENNIVTEVIVGVDETQILDGLDTETWYGNFRSQTCKRTSYNTLANVHIKGGTPFRKNYASIGFTYDAERDAFIPPKPFESWLLDEQSCIWVAPTPYPDDGEQYLWNESIVNWELVETEEE